MDQAKYDELEALYYRCRGREHVLVEALNSIAGGNFKGASTLAMNGDWRAMVNELQNIARQALADKEG